MTEGEQAWLGRVEGALAAVEAVTASESRVREVPMDLVAIATMKELARMGVVEPFPDASVTLALRRVIHRYSGGIQTPG